MNFQTMLSNRCLNSWLLRDFPAVLTVSEIHLIPLTSHIRDILSSEVFKQSWQDTTPEHSWKAWGAPVAHNKELFPELGPAATRHHPPSTHSAAEEPLLSPDSGRVGGHRRDVMHPAPHTDPVTMVNKLQRDLFCLPTAKLACSMHCTESSFK